MKVIGVAELKATLSSQLSSVKSGEEVIVTERGRPIARIVPMSGVAVPERVESLARRGLVRLPRRAPTARVPLAEDPEERLLHALLDEREEGR